MEARTGMGFVLCGDNEVTIPLWLIYVAGALLGIAMIIAILIFAWVGMMFMRGRRK